MKSVIVENRRTHSGEFDAETNMTKIGQNNQKYGNTNMCIKTQIVCLLHFDSEL